MKDKTDDLEAFKQSYEYDWNVWQGLTEKEKKALAPLPRSGPPKGSWESVASNVKCRGRARRSSWEPGVYVTRKAPYYPDLNLPDDYVVMLYAKRNLFPGDTHVQPGPWPGAARDILAGDWETFHDFDEEEDDFSDDFPGE